jgi:hypothetical protein
MLSSDLRRHLVLVASLMLQQPAARIMQEAQGQKSPLEFCSLF